jgi:hypothetical protein
MMQGFISGYGGGVPDNSLLSFTGFTGSPHGQQSMLMVLIYLQITASTVISVINAFNKPTE